MLDKKIARICWNTNSWCYPSGVEGKSKNKKSYEDDFGYGHEEWLFDTEKLINGYHYGFLQAANFGRKAHENSVLKVYLYSINSNTKTRWWIGSLSNLQIVQDLESQKIHKLYRDLGWFDEMLDQVNKAGGASETLRDTDPTIFFNIKFKPEDLILEETPKEFSASDTCIKSTYYKFQSFGKLPEFITHDFNFLPGHNTLGDSEQRSYKDHKIRIDQLHNQIQTNMYHQLTQIFGENNVGTEQLTSNGTRIDIAVRDDKKQLTFYEIKTSHTALGCIREALSQLLEYAYFPNSNHASKLVIVSPNKITTEISVYLKGLRDKFGIPIYYQTFNMKKMELIDELH